MCTALGQGDIAPSLVESRGAGAEHGFRAAQWYYGDGQLLNYHDSFRAVEAPLNKLNELGNALQRELMAGRDINGQSARLREIDRCTTEIVTALQRLESVLLIELT